MALSCLIPGAGGSYTLTQGHSSVSMGNVANTWMHDVSWSGMMSLGFSWARQDMDLRVVPAWHKEKNGGSGELSGEWSTEAEWLSWDV